ncbi:1-acyl-sn-glycerol-3-phosphate acyltransferase [Botrimarina colliarenosi]|uniref:1-acyl-sn-glycerol-3-phosphate acyltransferase n=1 Tax=Botrimarina colliarenosi TaxID=2528001 RepID=A0A5C6ALM5_9BACT|nr:1-acyl-sn-glycerol-3-phosphate acyltransferase [Botrimarina colliarenosi]TWU00311.1 1-acyl-sn-glycerol-3-phosphate acyltransferase [Botrimarina colliarenosi]
MFEIVREEPYEFVPPVESPLWCWIVRTFRLRGYMRDVYRVETFDYRGSQHLQDSLDRGAGILLAANHSRLADPMAMGFLSGDLGTELYAMASWHLFMEGWWQRFLIRRMGAFSVYREGVDRQAVNQAIDILVENKRPLLIFPEGAVSRHCDILMEFMDGPGFIARQASKRREKAGKGPVVIHPVAIRYSFDGDVDKAVASDLEAMEKSFSWQPQTHLPTHQRLRKIGEALLTLKEVEYLGAAVEGEPHQRALDLIATTLRRIEQKWGVANGDKDLGYLNVVARVKKIRTVVLPDLIAKKVPPAEREDRWRDLATCYYLQQIAHYPRGYITGQNDLPERVIETVERMVEDYQDRASYHGPLHCTIEVGEPIEVSAERDRSAETDPAMALAAERIQAMLDGLAAERRTKLFGEKKN